MPKNPNWTRDELLLALDLYLRCDRKQLDADHPDIIELSKLLNRLPIHPSALREAEFRNPNGVSMKLGNFLRLDPEYEGAGLKRGGKLEQEVWDEFASSPYKLHQTAAAIRATYEQVGFEPNEDYRTEADDEVFPEGRVLTRLHRIRPVNYPLRFFQ